MEHSSLWFWFHYGDTRVSTIPSVDGKHFYVFFFTVLILGINYVVFNGLNNVNGFNGFYSKKVSTKALKS